MKKAPQIFLSYAREDRPIVEKGYRRLLDEGLRPWMDVMDIRPGELWEDHIKKAIRESDFVLVFLSRNTINKRGFLQREIKSALEIWSDQLDSDVYLIPVRLEDSEVPDSLRDFQWLNLFEEDAWDRLLRAIEVGVERKGIVGLRESIQKEKLGKPKGRLFVAMPFSKEMEDIYFYGIRRAADAAGFTCERVDKESFTGDILGRVKSGIETSSAIVADLTGANPNVYLEVGYAWGKEIPTILLIQDGVELCFDVRGQRCLKYDTIRSLEETLTIELEQLKSKGRI